MTSISERLLSTGNKAPILILIRIVAIMPQHKFYSELG
jgi:hypothetical protein